MTSPSRIGKLSAIFDPIYSVKDSGILDFRMFLDGNWVFLEQRIDVHSPIDDSVIATIPSSSKEEAKLAVDSSYGNRNAIRTIPAVEKLEMFRTARDLLLENMESFTTVLIHEAGKPRANAEGEVKATAERLKLTPDEYGKIRGEHIPGDWSEETVGTSADVLREPLGVVLAIAPFNYPLYITATKVIPALLAGNSVVVKTSSKDPLSFLLFSHVLELAGIPKGTLNVITGRGIIGEYLASNEKISMLTFTGSTEIGKRLSQVAGLKRLHMELGGKGSAIVLSDADLDLAAAETVKGSLSYSGQRCVLPGTTILGDNKAVEEYAPGNHVLGDAGKVEVLNVYSRRYTGKVVTVKGIGMLPFTLTSEHPLLAFESPGRKVHLTELGFIEAAHLKEKHRSKPGDYLAVPRLSGGGDKRLSLKAYHDLARPTIRETFPLTESTSWLLGLYTAEGSCSRTKRKERDKSASAVFNLGRHEKSLIKRTVSILSKLGYKPSLYVRNSTAEVKVHNSALARALDDWCGHTASHKKIPEFILLHRKRSIARAYLTGYLTGDGNKERNCVGKWNGVAATTVSRLLAFQLQLLGAKLGIFFRISRMAKTQTIMGRKISPKEKYKVSATLRGNIKARFTRKHMLVPIREVRLSDYEGAVHNLETKDHTYLIGPVVSHNCDAVSRVLVEQKVADAFVSKVLKEVEGYKLGDPRDPSVKMGPLIDRAAAERVHGLVLDAIEKGASLLKGGRHDGGYYFATVLDEVPLDAKIVWEETFGPVIPIVRVKDVDEAIELANRSRYGLDSCVFTNSINLARKVAKRLEEGEVTVNAAPRHGVGYYPFGGNKDSGIGREGIGYSIEEMTRLKTIVYNWRPAKVWNDLLKEPR
jgi:acyl-CoA reductase-like NAD-dependent aldehyde dehydrogenase